MQADLLPLWKAGVWIIQEIVTEWKISVQIILGNVHANEKRVPALAVERQPLRSCALEFAALRIL